MIKKIIIIGGEGNGGVVAACINDMKNNYEYKFDVLGFLNDYKEEGSFINGYPVLGKTTEANNYFNDDNILFSFAIHPVGHGSLRSELFKEIGIPNHKLATIIHPKAFISENATIQNGVFIMANCYIGPVAIIKKCALIMANSVIGHNTIIGKYCHISAGAVISSYVKIGKASDVALNATVLDKINIGKNSVAGAGAVITKDLDNGDVAVGNPARVIRKATDKTRY